MHDNLDFIKRELQSALAGLHAREFITDTESADWSDFIDAFEGYN